MTQMPGGEVLVYETPEGDVRVDVRLDRDTVWLTQRQMADLFDSSVDNIGLHLKSVFLDNELHEVATTEDFSVVQSEGNRRVRRQVKHYNLDAIISVGYRVAELAGRTLKKVSLELGGNNALIVLDDADLELVVNNAAWGAFLHQGQICMASSRIFVHESIAARFTEKLAEKAGALLVGDPAKEPAALGPLINSRQLQRVRSILEDSVKAGARIVTGGGWNGVFHKATVLAGVKPGMRSFDPDSCETRTGFP